MADPKQTYYLRHAADETVTVAVRTADNVTEEFEITASKPFTTSNPLYTQHLDARVNDPDYPVTSRAPARGKGT